MAQRGGIAGDDLRGGFVPLIPYGRQQIDQSDIDAVVAVLSSDWLTTGPKIGEFEAALARYAAVDHAVAVSSGTAALHCAAYAIGIQPGDEVIVPCHHLCGDGKQRDCTGRQTGNCRCRAGDPVD